MENIRSPLDGRTSPGNSSVMDRPVQIPQPCRCPYCSHESFPLELEVEGPLCDFIAGHIGVGPLLPPLKPTGMLSPTDLDDSDTMSPVLSTGPTGTPIFEDTSCPGETSGQVTDSGGAGDSLISPCTLTTAMGYSHDVSHTYHTAPTISSPETTTLDGELVLSPTSIPLNFLLPPRETTSVPPDLRQFLYHPGSESLHSLAESLDTTEATQQSLQFNCVPRSHTQYRLEVEHAAPSPSILGGHGREEDHSLLIRTTVASRSGPSHSSDPNSRSQLQLQGGDAMVVDEEQHSPSIESLIAMIDSIDPSDPMWDVGVTATHSSPRRVTQSLPFDKPSDEGNDSYYTQPPSGSSSRSTTIQTSSGDSLVSEAAMELPHEYSTWNTAALFQQDYREQQSRSMFPSEPQRVRECGTHSYTSVHDDKELASFSTQGNPNLVGPSSVPVVLDHVPPISDIDFLQQGACKVIQAVKGLPAGPIYFNKGYGVSLGSLNSLADGNEPAFDSAADIGEKASIQFELLQFRGSEWRFPRQIRVRKAGRNGCKGPPITMKEMARRAFDELERLTKRGGPLRHEESIVNMESVVLMRIDHVSKGGIQPILGIRKT